MICRLYVMLEMREAICYNPPTMPETETRKHGRLFLILTIIVLVIFGLTIAACLCYRPVRAWYNYSQLEKHSSFSDFPKFCLLFNKAIGSDDRKLSRFRAFLNSYEFVDQVDVIYIVAAVHRGNLWDRLEPDIRNRLLCKGWASIIRVQLPGRLNRDYGGIIFDDVDMDEKAFTEMINQVGPSLAQALATEFIFDLSYALETGGGVPLSEYYLIVSQWYQSHGDEECVAVLTKKLREAQDGKIKFAIACMLAHMNYVFKDVPLPPEVAPILKKWFKSGNPWEYRWLAACEIQVAGIGKVPASFLIEAIEKGGKYRRAALESFAYPYPEVGGMRLRETKFRRALAGKEDYVFFFRHASPPARLVPILLELWRNLMDGKADVDAGELDAIRAILFNITPHSIFKFRFHGSPDEYEEIWKGKTRDEVWSQAFAKTLELFKLPDFSVVNVLPHLKKILISDSGPPRILVRSAFYILRRLWAFPCYTLDEDDGKVAKERFEEWFKSVEGKTREQILREALDRDMEIVLNHAYDHYDQAAEHKLMLAMNRLFHFCADEYVRTLEDRFRRAGLYVWEEWPRSKRVVDDAKKWWKENRETVRIREVKLFPEQ